jgi:hypothetical protein
VWWQRRCANSSGAFVLRRDAARATWPSTREAPRGRRAGRLSASRVFVKERGERCLQKERETRERCLQKERERGVHKRKRREVFTEERERGFYRGKGERCLQKERERDVLNDLVLGHSSLDATAA